MNSAQDPQRQLGMLFLITFINLAGFGVALLVARALRPVPQDSHHA